MDTNTKIIQIKKKNWYADYLIQWKPLQMCNYDCSYCDPRNHELIDVNRMPLVDKLVSVSDKIRRSIPSDKTVAINITGGEPFLIEDVHLWLENMMHNVFNVSIFSNGSMPIKIYKPSLPALKKIRIFLSFHPEFVDEERFADLATMLHENGGPFGIRGMMVPTLFDKTERMSERLTKIGIEFIKVRTYALVNRDTLKINPPYSSSRYLSNYRQHGDMNIGYFSEEEITKLKAISQAQSNVEEKQFTRLDCDILENEVIKNINTSGFSIMAGNLNRFKGWKCGLRMKKIVINPDGQTTHGLCTNELPLGNIFEEDFIIYDDKYTDCKQNYCMSIDEIMIDKYDPELIGHVAQQDRAQVS